MLRDGAQQILRPISILRGQFALAIRGWRSQVGTDAGLLPPSERLADFPVQAERVDKAADAPAVTFADGENLRGAGRDGFGEGGIGIGDGEDEAEILAAEGSLRVGLRIRGVRV